MKTSTKTKHPHDDAYKAAEQLNILGDILMQETIDKVRSDFSQISTQILDDAMSTFGDFGFTEENIKRNGGKYPKFTLEETARRVRLARTPCSFVMQNDIHVAIPPNKIRDENLDKIQRTLNGLNSSDKFSGILLMRPY